MAKQNDHDLLIQIDTKLGRVIADVQELKDNTTQRITDLENEKLNKEEAKRLLEDSEKLHTDHEDRLRILQEFKDKLIGKYSVIAGILLILIPIIVSWIFKKLTS